MMQLKNYQTQTLNVLQRFFEQCRIAGPQAAFANITSEFEIANRLGTLKSDYVVWDSIPNTPRVCIKIPTGGGKTVVGAHAIKIVADIWCETEHPFVLWVVPNDSIRKQTSEALKNSRHPYRRVLDEQFGGRVRIFDLDEKFNIRPADTENGLCVVVTTIQAFRQSKIERYNVYAHNENLEPHFTKISATASMDVDEKGQPKFSFANLINHLHPIMIVDEAHNEISRLTRETFGRLNPSAIIEMTATPQLNNNTLYNVRAAELKEEEMIKLPIDLREHDDWELAVTEAIAKRKELEDAATNEKDYVRPIILFQAQDKNGEHNIESLNNYLIEVMNIPKEEIAIVTGEQKELDGIDVFSRDCKIKYIITVEALKEGWDCSFAYVLCSLANVRSNTAVIQLLGRVMRMPYAKNRRVSALNKAYAYVMKDGFAGQAAEDLVRALQNRGFDNDEAQSAIQQKPVEIPGLFGRPEQNKVDLDKPLDGLFVPQTIKLENDNKTIVFTDETKQEDIELLCQNITAIKANEVRTKFYNYQHEEKELSFAAQNKEFKIPAVLVQFAEQDDFVLAEPDVIFEQSDWNIEDYAKPVLTPAEFSIERQGTGYVIDIDRNRLAFTASSEQLAMDAIEVECWTVANLIHWLDSRLHQDDIPQPIMVEWLRKLVEYLQNERRLPMPELMIAKYALLNKIKAKIDIARQKARKDNFNQYMFERPERVKLDFSFCVEFKDHMYDGIPTYHGNYKFQKHFLGSSKIPIMDTDEEIECAKAIDSLPSVSYWIRNVARNPNSFRLPTSSDYFYPDFVALLNDGRLLVVEYKGGHLLGGDDTREKENIGMLWQKQSNGKGVFVMASKKVDGLDVSEQIRRALGEL